MSRKIFLKNYPFFHWLKLSVSDLEKILRCKDEKGNSPNFLQSQSCLQICEIIGKVSFPYKSTKTLQTESYIEKKSRRLHVCTLNDIKPELSVKKFFEIYFPPLYSQYFELIWDTYRNGHIHLFRPKYYKHFPTDPKKDGIWTKYNLSELIFGVLYTELDKLDNTETFERIKNKHLHINIIADKKNSIHYVFYLCPQMVYKDLLIGIKKYKRDLHKKRALQKQFLMGNKIYTQSTRLEWGKDRKYSRIESKLEKEAQTKLTSFNKLEGMIYKD